MNLAKNFTMAFALGMAMLLANVAKAQAPEAKILFLNLIWEKGSIRLQDYAVRPGRLKQGLKPKPYSQALIYELFAANNVKLGEGVLPNPSIERLEYADPAQPGVIKMTTTKRDTATFTLRLSYNRNLARVDFFNLKSPTPQSPGERGATVKALKGAKLGSVYLKLEEVKQ